VEDKFESWLFLGERDSVGFRKREAEPVAAAEHPQPASPSRVLCEGLFRTSDGYVASCPLWSEAVLPQALPSSQRPFNALFRALAQILPSGTISLFAFPTDEGAS